MPPLLALPVRIPAPGPSFPIITTASLPDATVGAAYSLQLSASSGTPPYTWSILSALPNTGSWLSLSSSGLLTGTPGTAELELLTIQVLDATGRTGSSPFRLSVAASIGGGLTHGQSFTASGFTGAGLKSRAAGLLIVDQCTAPVNTVDSQWSGHNPSAAGGNYDMQLQTVPFAPTGNSIGAPHSRVSRIYGGCHLGVGSNSGQVAQLLANISVPAAGYPYAFRATWYQRSDPGWTFGVGSPNDYNYKCWDFLQGASNNFWQQVTADNVLTSASVAQAQLNMTLGGPQILELPDGNGHNQYWGNWKNPMNASFGWRKQEIEVNVATATGLAGGGFINSWDGLTKVVSYAGRTDTTANGTSRTLAIGSYARDRSPHNYRYFADLRVDMTAGGIGVGDTCAGVWVGNASTFDTCTIRELQVPTAWIDGSVIFTFWQGALLAGNAWIFIKPQHGAMLAPIATTIN